MTPDELDGLLIQYLQGEIDAASLERLNAYLNENPQAAARLVELSDEELLLLEGVNQGSGVHSSIRSSRRLRHLISPARTGDRTAAFLAAGGLAAAFFIAVALASRGPERDVVVVPRTIPEPPVTIQRPPQPRVQALQGEAPTPAVPRPEVPPAPPPSPELPKADPKPAPPAPAAPQPERRPEPRPVPGTIPAAAVVAKVESITGGAVITQAGVRKVVPGTQDLLAGEGVETSGLTQVSFVDATRLELTSDTEIRDVHETVRGGKGKRLIVVRGTLSAEVVKQPAGLPMVILTPHAEATVLGTTLKIVVDGGSTRLEVTEGRVRFMRLSDRKAVDVTAGHFAVAAVGVEFNSKDLPIDEILLAPGSRVVVYGNHWKGVRDEKAFSGVAFEAIQTWHGATTPAYDLMKKKELGRVEFMFRADGGKDYHVWVRGLCLENPEPRIERWRYDLAALEFQDADATSKHLPLIDGRAYSFNGFGMKEGYWWVGANADDNSDAKNPVTIRFARTGIQVLRVYPIETPMRFDAVWLSATQKTRPDANQRGPVRPPK